MIGFFQMVETLFLNNLLYIFNNMSLIIAGAILWIVGKVAKISWLETVGFWAMVIGGVLWGLSFVGINIPIPI